MTTQLIIFINGCIYEQDTIAKTLSLVSCDGDYIPFTIYPFSETNVENFLRNNPEYKLIKEVEE